MKSTFVTLPQRRPALAIAMVAVLIASAGLAAVWTYTVDDAFIVLRYARNLLDGQGAVFNPGDRVEGCTSPLWLGLSTLAMLLPIPAETSVKLISLTAIGGLMMVAAHRWRRTPIVATTALALIGLYPPLLIAMASGLETAFNAALIGLLLLTSCGAVSQVRRMSIVGAAALACRPENCLLVALHGAYHWLARPAARRKLLLIAAAWLGVLAALTAARYAYYGRLVSNTSVSKLTRPMEMIDFSVMYLGAWTTQSWHLILGMGIGLVFRRTRRFALNALLLVLAQAAFVIVAGGDWMPGLRFMLPASIAAMIATGEAAHQLARLARARRRRPGRSWGTLAVPLRRFPMASAIACAVLMGCSALWGAYSIRTTRWSLANYEKFITALTDGPVAYLDAAAARNDIVAARDIGVLGYRLDCRILDLVGLTDAHIAETSGLRHREQLDLDYVYACEPRFFLIQSEKSESGDVEGCRLARRIQSDARFGAYERRGRWPMPERQYCEIYERRGSSINSAPQAPPAAVRPVDSLSLGAGANPAD